MIEPSGAHDAAACCGTSLRAEDLEYELPDALVATRPAEPRDSARMLVMRRSGPGLEHRGVRDLPDFLVAGDLLVVNDTRVVPALFEGRRAETGGRIDGLFLEERADAATPAAATWHVLLRAGGRLRAGEHVALDGADGRPSSRQLLLVADAGGGEWTVRPDPPAPAETVLAEVGRTPIPPYIRKARADRAVAIDDDRDRRWYQTVYALPDRAGSVAAPTAGLHFTPALLERLERRGVRRAAVTLHVGPGTFKPITAATLDAHVMHPERYEVAPATIALIRETRASGGRVVAVGTTTVRALESLPDPLPWAPAAPFTGATRLFIAPPREIRHADALLTNFHLPRSTLLALVAAFAGLDRVLAAYREAIARAYRFYSYGDAMLILP
jgi:S-adenosylmethionine:tRNA ribosyltransferase-isomerase